MRTRRPDRMPLERISAEPTLPPGTGFLIVGMASILVWGMIAGVAAIV